VPSAPSSVAAVEGSALELARMSVFLDFDGTISTHDVGRHILARTAPPEWRNLHEQYERGEIGSRACIAGQWALVGGDEATVRAVAREVALDPGFEALVRELRGGGADVAVVSDGFGFYVQEACAPLGLDVYTNAVEFAPPRTLHNPNEDRSCPCAACGVCKQAPIRAAQERGRTAVLVGDGASDRHAALVADLVFAKADLADWCAAAGVEFVRFGNLDDVRRALGTAPAARA
jgi:2-hydroxy-3-keto-5-methylthiopentenyl-1-phosphate phosphatase